MGVSAKVSDGSIVGALVYEAYTPAKCFKVIEDLGLCAGSSFFHNLRVKNLKGIESVKSSAGLNDFEELVADHKRKYDRHLATLEKLKAL